MNKKFVSKVILILSIFAMICLTSCSEIVDENNEQGYFVFNFPEGNPVNKSSSRVAPSGSILAEKITMYHVVIEGDDENIEFDLDEQHKKFIQKNLRISQYLIKITGYRFNTDKGEYEIAAYGEQTAVPLPDGINPSEIVEVAKKLGYDVELEDVQNNVQIKVYALTVGNIAKLECSKTIDTLGLYVTNNADNLIPVLEDISVNKIIYEGGYEEIPDSDFNDVYSLFSGEEYNIQVEYELTQSDEYCGWQEYLYDGYDCAQCRLTIQKIIGDSQNPSHKDLCTLYYDFIND